MNCNVENRTIFCHDNLDILQNINSNCIDLIYLDPPFNKNKVFSAPIGSSAEGASFKDIFKKEDVKDEWLLTIQEDYEEIYSFLTGIKDYGNKYNYCYLVYMCIRLMEMHRILKGIGSIYLHCDSTMSHYLKILMDCIFGEKNFRDEIVWKRATSQQKGSQYHAKSWGTNVDSILFYSKSKDYTINTERGLREEDVIEKFPHIDEKGRRYYDDSAHIWCTPGMGARPNLCYEWKGFKNPHPSGWRLSKERLQEEYEKGNIVITKAGKIERRKYLDDYKGVPIGNLWTDINPSQGKESVGYPTQKPLALLKRIIQASSQEGDIVLDPFCGCATTCVAAELLDRKWMGIDVSKKAYDLVELRLTKEIANPEHLFDSQKGLHFYVSPPKRTDIGADYREQKYVYIISHPNYPGEYKVGIAKDWKSRLNSYQTSDPDRGYKMEFPYLTPYFREIEKYIHNRFENKHEWVKGDLKDIIESIQNYKP